MKVETKSLDHLGIISGVCQEIGLVSLIDSLVKSDSLSTGLHFKNTQTLIKERLRIVRLCFNPLSKTHKNRLEIQHSKAVLDR